jgi:hypothetical protein
MIWWMPRQVVTLVSRVRRFFTYFICCCWVGSAIRVRLKSCLVCRQRVTLCIGQMQRGEDHFIVFRKSEAFKEPVELSGVLGTRTFSMMYHHILLSKDLHNQHSVQKQPLSLSLSFLRSFVGHK